MRAILHRPIRSFVLSGALLAACLPGVRAADEPNKAPSEVTQTPVEAKPDPNEPAGRKKILDDLFARLANAADEREARLMTRAIQRMWSRSGSDTADFLMSRAQDAMKSKDWALSEDLLEKIITLYPQWAEGWNVRATERFSADDYSGAIEDIAHTLALEPRHFGALAGLGHIMQQLDQKKEALAAYRKALEFNPRQEELKKAVDKLQLEVEGQEL